MTETIIKRTKKTLTDIEGYKVRRDFNNPSLFVVFNPRRPQMWVLKTATLSRVMDYIKANPL